ncbi:MAG TPA: ABC transporter ATP-binding protein [Acidimicrobiales bacterium]
MSVDVVQTNAPQNGQPPALEVRDLSVSFPLPGRPFRERRRLRAVTGVNLHIDASQTVGLVGESGSGKSTTARAVLRLVEPDTGTIVVAGRDITKLSGSELRAARRDVQMVFQDPYSSLNPSQVVAWSVAEPLLVHERLDRASRERAAIELLERVGLSRSHASRYPHEFSGGQRQRIAIARALALRPRLIVCDEAVSALDVSTQIQIIQLLEDLQRDEGVSYLFIAHDLGIVRHICHRVAVMYLGQVVEEGPTERLFSAPQHPYTQALLSAVPVADPRGRDDRKRIKLQGEPPDPADPPAGCPFHPRCPMAAEQCRVEVPLPRTAHGDGRVSCHLATGDRPRHG